MDYKQMAIQCGASVYEYDQNEYDYEDEYTFVEKQLKTFAQAVIAAYVAEQKPVAWTNKGWKCIPLYTLEVNP